MTNKFTTWISFQSAAAAEEWRLKKKTNKDQKKTKKGGSKKNKIEIKKKKRQERKENQGEEGRKFELEGGWGGGRSASPPWRSKLGRSKKEKKRKIAPTSRTSDT